MNLNSIKRARELVKVAQQAVQKTTNPGTYTVVSGDTLSGIAQKFYGDQGHWPVIYEANKGQISNPNLIQPGWTLKIPNVTPQQLAQSKAKQSPEAAHPSFGQQSHSKPTYPKGNDDALQDQAHKLGLVRVDDIIQIANAHPFVAPELRSVLQNISAQFPGSLGWLTEGWPSTSTVHGDSRHYNGHAMDFTLTDRVSARQREQITQYIHSLGFRVVNEYDHPVSTTTGGHIHVGTSEAGPPAVAIDAGKPASNIV